MSRDVLDDDGTRPDEPSRTDGHTADDGGICANGATSFQTGRNSLGDALLHRSPRISVIRENAVRSEKDVVMNNHTVKQLDPVLHRDSIPDPDLPLNERMVTDIAINTDHRPGQNMGEGPDSGPSSDLVGLAKRRRMDKDRWVHKSPQCRSESFHDAPLLRLAQVWVHGQ